MRRDRATILASLLLCLSFGLQVTSARLKAPTYDEQGYIARGYAWVKLGDLHIRIGAPILLNALNALPLLSLSDVRLPVDRASWSGTDFHPIGEQFMWHVNENADQILFMARVPTMLLTLLLAVFVYRWSYELFGTWGGLLALALFALDPNILAHGRLATTDLGSTAFFFITAYWAWKLLRLPRWRYVLATGVSLGLALATKFNTLLLLPILGLLWAWRFFLQRAFALPLPPFDSGDWDPPRQRWFGRLGWLALLGVCTLFLAYLTLWAVYGFQVGPVTGLTSFPVLAPAHLEQFLDVSGRLAGVEGRQAQAFLMGELYVGGRLAYFPVAFALKTPIPTLILLLGAALLSIRKPIGRSAWALWLPPLIFFGFSLTSKLNLGYRYILPVLPFALVLAGRMGEWVANHLTHSQVPRRPLLLAALSILLGWSARSGLAIYPHYLAFFNEWAGGPEEGWRYLVDSNVDWGQDLKLLARWMETHSPSRIKLGYTGEAYPSYYGIDFDPLPSWPDRWGHHLYRDLYPPEPGPGYYAISVNLIQGRNLIDPDTYAWFRQREPIDKVGYSIFIYQVPKRGSGQAVLGLSGVHLSEVLRRDYDRLGTNDVRVLWFDARRALIAPVADDDAFLVLSEDGPLHPLLAGLSPPGGDDVAIRMASTVGCTLSVSRNGHSYHTCEGKWREAVMERVQAMAVEMPVWHLLATQFMAGDPDDHGQKLDYPIRFGDRIELLAYQAETPSLGAEEQVLRPGEALTLVTYWRVREPGEEPLKLFAHLLDADGSYRGGEDRLDVWYEHWRRGDLFVQVQQVPLEAGASPGLYQVEIGWYNPETMRRLPVMVSGVPVADRVLLAAVRAR